ncbi:MAG TPA: hypothetical protein VEA80_06490 [Vitreimonas sp.]|uniref:hypothetical protein n=1 Tax=Vitreimonas sp. TaxID=3069702 RepID=UPI002D6244EA|nr:hypothetical protein [Vitreimonas sp.]HYD87101.1 hypothetical protein [Vitreimonas sp.]
MKLAHLCAAFAIACAALMSIAPPAAAQDYAIDSSVVHPGADRVVLQQPSAEPSAQYETAELTQYQNDAADGGTSLPWGDLIAELLNMFGALVVAAVLFVFRKLPAEVIATLNAACMMLFQKHANELIGHAVNYGINVTAGAVRGKTLDFKVGSAVLERATDYAAERAPWFVKVILGGAANVRQMIAARLELAEDVALPLAKPPAEASFVSAAPPAPASAA